MPVFYRKYRPQKLADLVGQDHVKETLLAQLASGKISHGYLFAGPRGSGKTSTARILAKALNCKVYSSESVVGSKRKTMDNEQSINHFGEPCNKCHACVSITDGSYLDLIEIDAASNRGIDEIRDLREKIKLSPVAGKFKVYIVDEVHMLTTEAFNALLKTLEEPPAHAVFILCTTAPEKIPATILSRLSRFNFKVASDKDLAEVIEKIAKKEDVKIDKEAVSAIAKAADGAYRDALSILDQLAASKKTIGAEDVRAAFKLTGEGQLLDFLQKVFLGDLKAAVEVTSEVAETHDVANFTGDAILLLKQLLFIKIGVEVQPGYNLKTLESLAGSASYSQIQNLMKLLMIAESEMKLYPSGEIALILAVCKFMPEPIGDVGPVGNPSSLAAHKEGDTLGARRGSPAPVTRNTSATPSTVNSTPVKEKKLSKGAAKDLAEVEAKWGEFLAKVRPINAHVVALLRSARPVNFDGANLVLEVFFKFHKEKLEERKIIDMLCGVLGEVLEGPIFLSFVLANRESKPTKTVTVSDVTEIADDELSKMAAEIFSK